jgi:hypothetical protein
VSTRPSTFLTVSFTPLISLQTFCSRCLHRSLDHNTLCPLCRQDVPGFAYFREHPCNKVVLSLSVFYSQSLPHTSPHRLISQSWKPSQRYMQSVVAPSKQRSATLVSIPQYLSAISGSLVCPPYYTFSNRGKRLLPPIILSVYSSTQISPYAPTLSPVAKPTVWHDHASPYRSCTYV